MKNTLILIIIILIAVLLPGCSRINPEEEIEPIDFPVPDIKEEYPRAGAPPKV